MTSDGRKGLVFSYNVCNLPKEVTSSASGWEARRARPSAALPFIPGGAGTAIKRCAVRIRPLMRLRLRDKATDGVKATNSASEIKKASSISFVKKPYSKSRPAYGKNQVEDVWNAAKDTQGKAYDPFTGEELIWDKTMPRSWDMGHK